MRGANSPHPPYRFIDVVFLKFVVLFPFDNVVHVDGFDGDENVLLGRWKLVRCSASAR